ncbi:hypothetical protein [Paenibacillus beijingensis]|nr:hypothetical protein [Paenibacillus beijingensis]
MRRLSRLRSVFFPFSGTNDCGCRPFFTIAESGSLGYDVTKGEVVRIGGA